MSADGATINSDSTVTGALTVTGNLTVDGTTVFLDSSNVQTVDKVLRLAMEDSADNDYADTATAVAASTGAGIEVVTDTIANAANFAKLTWVNNTTTMTGWSVRDHNGTTYLKQLWTRERMTPKYTIYGCVVLQRRYCRNQRLVLTSINAYSS